MIEIPAIEQGTTRLFSLSMPAAQARALRKSSEAQQAILGVEHLNPNGVEVFPVTDLEELGLAGYLREGTDAQDADLKRDAPKLAALDGWVMLVHSLAFGGAAATLSPDPALTLIGTYTQTEPEKKHVELEAQAAKPYSGGADVTPAKAPDHKGRGSRVIAFLIVIAVLVVWWAIA